MRTVNLLKTLEIIVLIPICVSSGSAAQNTCQRIMSLISAVCKKDLNSKSIMKVRFHLMI